MKCPKKLGIVTRFCLVKKGKNDARKNIIYFDRTDINSSTSPFFKEELSLCLSKIHKEYEKYLFKKEKFIKNSKNIENKKIKLQLEINSLNREKDLQKDFIKDLNQKKYNNDFSFSPIFLRSDHEELFLDYDSFNKECRKIERQARYIVEIEKDRKQIEELSEAVLEQPLKVKLFEEKIEALNVFQSKEYEKLNNQLNIVDERCKQHYSFTLARLSAYWSGVLCVVGNSENISSQFYSLNIFEKLQDEIEVIRKGVE